MTDTELDVRFDRLERAIENNGDGCGCGTTIVIISLLLYIIHLLGGC